MRRFMVALAVPIFLRSGVVSSPTVPASKFYVVSSLEPEADGNVFETLDYCEETSAWARISSRRLLHLKWQWRM